MSDDDCEDETIEGGVPVVLIMGICTVLALIAFLIAYVLNNRTGAAGDSPSPPVAILKRCNCRRCRVLHANKPPPPTILQNSDELGSQEPGDASASASGSNQEVAPEPSSGDAEDEEPMVEEEEVGEEEQIETEG